MINALNKLLLLSVFCISLESQAETVHNPTVKGCEYNVWEKVERCPISWLDEMGERMGERMGEKRIIYYYYPWN